MTEKQSGPASDLPLARLWNELECPAAGEVRRVNSDRLRALFGPTYHEQVLSMRKAGHLRLELDSEDGEDPTRSFTEDYHPVIFKITFHPAGLDYIEEHRQRLRDEAAKAKQRRVEIAGADVRKLIDAEQIASNKKTLDVTGTRLESILGQEWSAALDGMVEAGYLLAWGERQDEAGTYTLTLTTRALEIVKTARAALKAHVRQVTVEGGKRIDIRNRANFDLLQADIREVEAVAQSYLHQFRIEGVTKGQRRRLICELHRVMLLRGKELSRPLYGSICLRLGTPLPPDFWTLPMLAQTTISSGISGEAFDRNVGV